jgi:predicted molibdopterin-dependent oxidoreductase YjgC
MTNTIADITQDAEVVLLIGSNPEEAHPVLGMQLRQAVERGTKLIVVDPREIGLTQHADIHLKLRPGTNVAFANGIVHILISEGLVDEEFVSRRTEGFEELAAMVASYTPERVAEICRIDKDDLISAAKLYGSAKTAPIMYCLGVAEHSTGTEGVMSLSNIAMVNGKLGRVGCGVNPIRGQNNVQGACDVGAIPSHFTGYQSVGDPAIRAKFEEAWGVKLKSEVGLRSTEVFPAAIRDEIEGLLIFGEDPLRTDPNTKHIIEALSSLQFFVVVDLFLTETASYADVVLPARSYAEKEGTFTNTERRVQRVRRAVEGPTGPKLDTEIITEIMNRMGYPQPQLSAAQIMDELASLTPSYAGISHARLDSEEIGGAGIQWPCPSKEHPGTPIMHMESFSRGRGTYSNAEYRESTEMPDEEYPLMMMTGRILYHYNASAMTARSEGINEISDSSFIEINAIDAQKLGINDGDMVRAASRRGQIEVRAHVSNKTNQGETWMPFHFQDGNSNWLTISALDEISRVPEYKVCAVKVWKP